MIAAINKKEMHSKAGVSLRLIKGSNVTLASKLMINCDSQQVTTIYTHDIVYFPLFHLCHVHVTVLQLHVILCNFGDFKFQFMRGITTLIL